MVARSHILIQASQCNSFVANTFQVQLVFPIVSFCPVVVAMALVLWSLIQVRVRCVNSHAMQFAPNNWNSNKDHWTVSSFAFTADSSGVIHTLSGADFCAGINFEALLTTLLFISGSHAAVTSCTDKQSQPQTTVTFFCTQEEMTKTHTQLQNCKQPRTRLFCVTVLPKLIYSAKHWTSEFKLCNSSECETYLVWARHSVVSKHGILLFFHEITYMIFSLSEKVDIFLRGANCLLWKSWHVAEVLIAHWPHCTQLFNKDFFLPGKWPFGFEKKSFPKQLFDQTLNNKDN